MSVFSEFAGGFVGGMFDEILIGIRGDNSDFKKSMREVQSDVKGIGGMLKGIGVLELAQTAAMIGPMIMDSVVRPISAGFQSIITASSNATEESSKFLAVFKGEGPRMVEWADETAKAMGRGLTMTKGIAASFGAMLDPMTGNTKLAADMSQAYTKLAIDLSSFYNVSEQEAAASLRSAIAGETEAVRKFGVVLNEAALNQELLAMGTGKTTKEASAAEKQQAIFNLIMRATVNAQGDAIRTADGYANRMRALTAQIEDVKVMLGDALMPIVKTFMDYIVKGVGWFKDKLDELAPSGKKFIDLINEMVKGGLNTLAKVILPIANAAFAALPGILEGVAGAFQGVSQTVGWLADAFGPVIERIRADVMPTLQGIATGIREAFGALKSWWDSSGKGIIDAIANAAMGVVKFIEPIGATLRDTIWPIIQQVGGWMMGEFKKWSDWWAADGKKISDAIGKIGEILQGGVNAAIQTFGAVWRDYVLPPLQVLASGVMEIVRSGISFIADIINSPGFQSNLQAAGEAFQAISVAVAPLGQYLHDAGGGLLSFFEQLSPANNDALYAFKMAVMDIMAYLEAMDRAQRGDLMGAYASLGKIYENELALADNYAKNQGKVNTTLQDQTASLDAARRGMDQYNKSVTTGTPHIMTYAEFVASLGKNATTAAPPLGRVADNVDQTGFVSKKWLEATGLQGQNIGTMGVNATQGNPALGTFGTNTDILGKNASAGNPGLGMFGENIGTAGINSSIANPYLYDTGANTYTIGANAGVANPPTGALAGNLNNVGSGGYNAANGLNAAAAAYRNYLSAMGAAIPTIQYAQAIGPIGPNGETPQNLTPTGSQATANWGTPTQQPTAAYAAAQGKALRDAEAAAKAREGPAGPANPASVVAAQYQEGGYWWTRFADGHVVRGPAVSTATTPGAKKSSPLRDTYGTYAPQYNLTFVNPKKETPSESLATVKRVDRLLGMRGGMYA